MARPFKVLIPEQKEQFGVVARSLRVLRDSIQRRYGLQSGFKIFLTDGTTVDNEEYFAFLEPQTLLIVKHAIPSGDTKTSVVDLTSKQVEALVRTERNLGTKHYQQQKNVSDKHSDKSAGTQSSAVSSIKIAKVQEDVEWENGGTSIRPNASSTSMHYQQQQYQVQPPVKADPVANSTTITLHHLNHMSYPTTQMAQTYSTPATSRASTVAAVVPHHQSHRHQPLQGADVAMLQELYQQGQLQKRYYHQIMSQTQPCNAALRPSQRYYLQQVQQQQGGRNRNLQIVRQLSSSCGYNGTDVVQQKQQQQLMYIPPH